MKKGELRDSSDEERHRQEKLGYCRARGQSESKNQSLLQNNNNNKTKQKMYKNKTLIFLYPKMVREEKGGGGRDSVRERGSREEQANDLALNERKQSETWRGCVLFCLSVMTLRSLLHALCYRC